MAIHITKRGPLNETERHTLINALLTAADTFQVFAKHADPLREHFEEQAQTVTTWADLIDECEEITIR